MGIMDRFKKETKAAEKHDHEGHDHVHEEETTVAAPKNVKNASKAAMSVVVRPLVTEKAAHSQSSTGTYSFIVTSSANKIQIAKAVEELYGVKPVAVRVANVQGKVMRYGRSAGKRSDFKKAMVTLKKGDSITIHEGV